MELCMTELQQDIVGILIPDNTGKISSSMQENEKTRKYSIRSIFLYAFYFKCSVRRD